ncbi:oxidoreductase [Pedobacter sp. WC2423]|uniref:oxidoreductase n=1 Tax=Pedobacter sp. WC2423 TaxID=3234142 RepID=UPI0034671FE0
MTSSATMTKVWFITGSSRGLGRNLAESVLASGANVVATARNPEQLNDLLAKYPDQLYPVKLDVTDQEQINQAVKAAIGHFGHIDVLVNNACFGITGAAEAFTDQEVRSQLETNLNAPIAITRAILPYMRKQRSGRILQISSVGGRVGHFGLTIYQAAKFGLSGFSEALAQEVAHLGIYVTSIEPGGFRTDWAGDSMSYAQKAAGYESTVDQIAGLFKAGNFVPMGDPDKAAKVMIELADHPKPPVHLILGSEAVGLVKHAEALKMAEFEEWIPVSVSTDHADAVNFLETEEGKTLLKKA